MSIGNLIRLIVSDTDYIHYMLKKEKESKTSYQIQTEEKNNDSTGSERIDQLIDIANDYEQDYDGDNLLADFLRDILEMSELSNKGRNGVLLTTAHSSKGLEFDRVFILRANEGYFPAEKSSEHNEDIEEECRLLYVAMTRARKFLHIYRSTAEFDIRSGQVMELSPSRFIIDFPEVSSDSLRQTNISE